MRYSIIYILIVLGVGPACKRTTPIFDGVEPAALHFMTNQAAFESVVRLMSSDPVLSDVFEFSTEPSGYTNNIPALRELMRGLHVSSITRLNGGTNGPRYRLSLHDLNNGSAGLFYISGRQSKTPTTNVVFGRYSLVELPITNNWIAYIETEM